MPELKPLTEEEFADHAMLRQLRALRKQLAEMECTIVGRLRRNQPKRKAADDDYRIVDGKKVKLRGKRL